MQAALDRLLLAAAQHLDLAQRQVVAHGQMRKQLEILEHHADARPQRRQIRALGADRGAIHADFALLERFQPVDGLNQVDLPEPDGPQITITSPFLTLVLQSFSTWNWPYHLLIFLISIIGK
jgi:hypothetical protein